MFELWCDLLAGWKLIINAKFQHSISKITPTRPKNLGTWGVNTAIINCYNKLSYQFLPGSILLHGIQNNNLSSKVHKRTRHKTL